MPRTAARQGSQRRPLLGLCAAAVFAAWQGRGAFVGSTSRPQVHSAWQPEAAQRTARAAATWESLKNPVKTVSETIADFYKAYPQPPVLPMWRNFLVDLMTQTHLSVVDARFKYDAVFALGLWNYYSGLMGTYDKMTGGPQTEKIWSALCKAVGLNGETVKADAQLALAYAKETTPAQILSHLEGGVGASPKLADAFQGIGSSLYSMPFSIGLFKIMETSGVEASKANVEEWAKALKVVPSKATSDLETYKQNQNKLQKAEEMLREIEIREKKKLAERLEEKAKALAAKAAQKAAAAAGDKA